MSENGPFILEIKNLSIGLPKSADRTFAVENASLQLKKGEVLCIVGESGSGKSVMTSAILKDISPGLSLLDGEILYSCLLYTSPSPRDGLLSRMPSSA